MHITIARIKTFASVSKETSPILVTRVLSKGKLNTDKKTFLPVRLKTPPEWKKKKEKNNGNCKTFCVTMQTQKENKNKKTNGNCRAFCVIR